MKITLLRGLSREAEHWGTFPEILIQAFEKTGLPRPKLHLPDLLGAGVHYKQDAPATVEEHTQFLRGGHSEKEREQGGCIIVGLSLGGMIAADWMQRFPEEWSGGVLINSSFGGLSPPHHRLKPSALAELAKIASSRTAREKERHILNWISNRPEVRQAVEERWAQIQELRPVFPMNTARQLYAATKFNAVPRPMIPALILTSSADKMVEPSCSERIAASWAAELEVHSTAGHDLPLDEPEWVAEKIARWSKKVLY